MGQGTYGLGAHYIVNNTHSLATYPRRCKTFQDILFSPGPTINSLTNLIFEKFFLDLECTFHIITSLYTFVFLCVISINGISFFF